MKTKSETKWVSIIGNFSYVGENIKYKPSIIQEGPNAGQNGIALIKSNIEFENGEISFNVRLEDEKSQVQIGFNNGNPPEFYAGLNLGNAVYGIAAFNSGKWENIISAGFGQTLPTDKDINVRVVVNGSNCELFIDGVSVCFGTCYIRRCQIALLLSGSKEFEIKHFKCTKAQSLAFIVMQFTDEYDALYKEVIEPTCKEFGLASIRADDIYNNGLIINDISMHIKESTVVIADITPNNPNVFYEVGFAHGIDKPTILLSDRKRDKLPFDVSGFRTIFYDNTIGGKSEVQESLKKHLKNILGI